MSAAEKIEQAIEAFREEREDPHFDTAGFVEDVHRVYGTETANAIKEIFAFSRAFPCAIPLRSCTSEHKL